MLYQEKQVRDALAKDKTRQEQEKKLMYTSSNMRYTAMENGGQFQLNSWDCTEGKGDSRTGVPAEKRDASDER